MAGNKEGGIKTAKSIEDRYGHGYWSRIGRKGGKAKKTSPAGFAYLKSIGQEDKIAEAGRKGGALSKPYSRNPKYSEWERRK